jgi:hypothetical protein
MWALVGGVLHNCCMATAVCHVVLLAVVRLVVEHASRTRVGCAVYAAEGQVYGEPPPAYAGRPGEHAYQLQRYLAGPLTEVQWFKFICRAGVVACLQPGAAFTRARPRQRSAHSTRSARRRPCIMLC